MKPIILKLSVLGLLFSGNTFAQTGDIHPSNLAHKQKTISGLQAEMSTLSQSPVVRTANGDANDLMIGSQIAMQGKYIEVGVGSGGFFGTKGLSLDNYGYHRDNVGFLADSDKDGWDNGNPSFWGDFFLPGTHEEGMSITFNGRTYSNNGIGDNDISLRKTSLTYDCDRHKAMWSGHVNGLDVFQTVSFRHSSTFFFVTTELTNTTSAKLSDVYYLRNVDPDNTQEQNGRYDTTNKIWYQPNKDSEKRALVSATGVGYEVQRCFLGMATVDDRARVSYGGFHNRSPRDVYEGNNPFSHSGQNTADKAISLAFRVGDINPGETAIIEFAYILDPAAVEEAFSELIKIKVNGVDITGDLYYKLASSSSINLKIDNPKSYSLWTWYCKEAPDAFSSTTGTSVSFQAPDSGTYTITLVGSNECGESMTRTFRIEIDMSDNVPPVAYVQPEYESPTNVLEDLTWLVEATDDVASKCIITQSVDPGTILQSGVPVKVIFYVSDGKNTVEVYTMVTYYGPQTPVANEAVVLTPYSARLSWSMVEPVTSYRLEVSTDSTFYTSAGNFNSTVTSNEAVVTGLEPGFYYYYRVSAVNANLSSHPSNIVEFSTTIYQVNFTAGDNGSISGPATQSVSYGGSTSPVTAVPENGYSFYIWSDDDTTNPRVIRKVTSDLDIFSYFSLNNLQFGVQPSANIKAGDPIYTVVDVVDNKGKVVNTTKGDISLSIDAGDSVDGEAALNGNSTATINEGKASFGAIFITKPGQGYVLNASNSVTPSMALSAPFNIVPADADYFVVEPSSKELRAGEYIDLTVTVFDRFGNRKDDYQGLVSVTSADSHFSSEEYPEPVRFTSADKGEKVISGLKLTTAGRRSVTVSDASLGVRAVVTDINVVNDVAAAYSITGFGKLLMVGEPASFQTEVLDLYGNRVVDYAGTVSFASDESTAGLPSSYLFTKADAGLRVFSDAITFNKAGSWNMEITEAGNASVSGIVRDIIVKHKIIIAANKGSKIYGEESSYSFRLLDPETMQEIANQYITGVDFILSMDGSEVVSDITNPVGTYQLTPGNPRGSFEPEMKFVFISETYEILPRVLSVASPKVSKTYDATTQAIFTPGQLQGILDSDNNGIALGYTAFYDNENVGAGKDVIIDYILSGSASGNYVAPSQQIVKGEIIRKKLTVSDVSVTATKIYDGTAIADVLSGGILSGVVGNDNIDHTATAFFNSATTAATGITVSFSISGERSFNYESPDNQLFGSVVISPRQLEAGAPTLVADKIYDSSARAEVISSGNILNMVPGDEFQLVLSGEAYYDDKNIGTNKGITVIYEIQGDKAANYIAPLPYRSSGSISARQLELEGLVVEIHKIHDGNTSAIVADQGQLVGVATADISLVSCLSVATYNDSEIGENKVIEVRHTLTGEESGNYLAPAKVTLTGATIAHAIIIDLELLPNSCCAGSDISLDYIVNSGDPIEYCIIFDEAAIDAGFSNIGYFPVGDMVDFGTVSFAIPAEAGFGIYHGYFKMRNKDKLESARYPFSFKVNLSDKYIMKKFNDIVFVSDPDKLFTSYQWYKDGDIMQGEVGQYICENAGVEGGYSVEVETRDGEKYMSCERVFIREEEVSVSVSVNPNPARSGSRVEVLIGGVTSEDIRDAALHIYSATGMSIVRCGIDDALTTLQADWTSGVYYGNVILSAGKEMRFKLIINE